MNKIPFNISYRDKIEKGEFKVVTRDNRPVRIICFDKAGKNCIVALMNGKYNDETENVVTYTSDGKFGIGESNMDLFIVGGEELSDEFECALQEFASMVLNIYSKENPYVSKDSIESWKHYLQDISKKQFANEVPHWKKGPEFYNGLAGLYDTSTPGDHIIIDNGYTIGLKELRKLPKED